MSSEVSFNGAAIAATPAVTAGAAPASAPVAPLPGQRATAPAGDSVLPVHHATAAPDVLQQAAQRVVDAMQNGGNSFQFSFDKQSGMTIVKVFNRATGELVRQIPGEEIVHVAQLLRQDEQRSLLDIKV